MKPFSIVLPNNDTLLYLDRPSEMVVEELSVQLTNEHPLTIMFTAPVLFFKDGDKTSQKMFITLTISQSFIEFKQLLPIRGEFEIEMHYSHKELHALNEVDQTALYALFYQTDTHKEIENILLSTYQTLKNM